MKSGLTPLDNIKQRRMLMSFSRVLAVGAGWLNRQSEAGPALFQFRHDAAICGPVKAAHFE